MQGGAPPLLILSTRSLALMSVPSWLPNASVYRFIGVWQQESSQRPQRENGATVRASSLIPYAPSLWGIAGTARPVKVSKSASSFDV